ncbi:MAG TPA: VOC family protein [Longimicrobiales bacterium]|nr:VOC family protein [Longimicrobiales bacterium]
MKLRRAVPFFAVSDMQRSVRYYVHGLGFDMKRDWTVGGELRWCWLERDEVALMLQAYPRDDDHAWSPTGQVGEGVTIYFLCDDALAVYRDFRSRGVDAAPPFVGNRMWVTYLRDPDGYSLAFESPTDAPEGMQYAELEAAAG